MTESSVNDYIEAISHKIITLDTEEIENDIRKDGEYCKFTDGYLITVIKLT